MWEVSFVMRFEIRIALFYFIIGSLWILGSDAVVAVLFGDAPGKVLLLIQANKGMAYIFVTSILLYLLVRADAQERQAEESNYQLLFTHNPNSMWVYDAVTLRFIEVNNRALETYGYSRDEFLQMTIMDIHPPDERLTLKTFLAQPRLAKFRVHEWQHQTCTGEVLNVEITSQQLEYNNRLATLVVIRDITERKQLQSERIAKENLRVQLEREQEAHVTRSRFFSMASHDFRTPLATITAAASFLHRYDDGRIDVKKRKDQYQKITRQAYHLSGQLDEMLTILRTEMAASNYQPQPHDIVALCQDVVANLSEDEEDAKRLAFNSNHDALTIDMDANLMQRVLTNLVANALKYSDKHKPVHLALSGSDKNVEIIIQDEGIGIPESEIDRLFEPFFRANNVNSIKGTGLGLTIVKQAVELHGGTVTVKSVEGEGTIFYIDLPLHQPMIVEAN